MKYISFLFVGFLLIGCSSRVQTNPISEDKKYILPLNTEIKLNRQVSVKHQSEFMKYADEFFYRENREHNKNIWQIGLERGHYEKN